MVDRGSAMERQSRSPVSPVTGNELQSPCLPALGKRNQQRGGCSLSGGNARNDQDFHARGPAGRDLLGCSAEDQGIASLEPNDILSRLSKLDHQCVDLRLVARDTVPSLADRNPFRLAARKLKYFRADQPIMKNDGRGLQR